MYLWKVDQLASELGNNQVSQKEQFKYTLVFTLLTTFFMGVAGFGAEAVPAWLMAIDMAIALTIAGFGILYCYHCNQGSGNRDFILRFMCLGLPVTIRVAVFGALAGFAFGLVVALMAGNDAVSQSGSGVNAIVVANLCVSYAIQAAYFIYLARCMASVGGDMTNPEV